MTVKLIKLNLTQHIDDLYNLIFDLNNMCTVCIVKCNGSNVSLYAATLIFTIDRSCFIEFL